MNNNVRNTFLQVTKLTKTIAYNFNNMFLNYIQGIDEKTKLWGQTLRCLGIRISGDK